MNKLNRLVEETGLSADIVAEAITLNKVISDNVILQEMLPIALSVGILKEDVLKQLSSVVDTLHKLINEFSTLSSEDILSEGESTKEVTNRALVRLCPDVCNPEYDADTNTSLIIEKSEKLLFKRFLVENGLDDACECDKEPHGTI